MGTVRYDKIYSETIRAIHYKDYSDTMGTRHYNKTYSATMDTKTCQRDVGDHSCSGLGPPTLSVRHSRLWYGLSAGQGPTARVSTEVSNTLAGIAVNDNTACRRQWTNV